MPRHGSCPSDPAPDFSDFDKYSDFRKEDQLWRKRESRRKKKAAAAAAAKTGRRFGSVTEACMPTYNGEVTMGGSIVDGPTSAHAERLRLPRIREDALLAAEFPPPAVHSVAAELLKLNDSHVKLWFWQMTGEDLVCLNIDEAKKAWRNQYRRWWKIVKLDKYNEAVRLSKLDAVRDRTGRVRSMSNAVRVLQRWRKRVLLQRESAYAAVRLDRERYYSRSSILRTLLREARIEPDLFVTPISISGHQYTRSAQARRHSYAELEDVLRTDISFESEVGEAAYGDIDGFVARLGRMCFRTQCFHDDELVELFGSGPPYLSSPSSPGYYANRPEHERPLCDVASTAIFVRVDPNERNCGPAGACALTTPLWNLGRHPSMGPSGYRRHMPVNLSPIWLPGKEIWVGMGRTRFTLDQLEFLRLACARYIKSRFLPSNLTVNFRSAVDEAESIELNALDGIHSAWRACEYDVFYSADDCDSDGTDSDGVDADDKADWKDLYSDDDDAGIPKCDRERQRSLLVAYLKGIPKEYLGPIKYRTSDGHSLEPVFCMGDPDEWKVHVDSYNLIGCNQLRYTFSK
jgi:hypothetical protein